MAAEHTVHAAFFIDDRRDKAFVPHIASHTKSLHYKEVSPFVQKLLSLRALLNGKSLTEMAYPYRDLRKYATALAAEGKLDAIFVFSAAAAPIARDIEGVPIICDLVDVDSQKWQSYAEKSRWPLSWLYAREAKKLGRFEASLAEHSKACLLVSEDEAALFCSLNSTLKQQVTAIPNGVDISQFDPGLYTNDAQSNRLLFSGAMDYQPNIDAVTWFCENVLPLVQQQLPDLEFVIAGGPTPPAVARLARLRGVSVLGYVDDMAEMISTATVCIAPLQIARGIQNKVLEAMAMAKPVVATSLANEGINAVHGSELLMADTPSDFASAIKELFENPDMALKLGDNARNFVSLNFSWNHSFELLNAYLLGE